MLLMNPILNDFPSGHVDPLYRLHRGSPSTIMTKNPTPTLSSTTSQHKSFLD